MRKAFAAAVLLTILVLIGTAGCAQKKDSVVQYDTVYLFKAVELNHLKSIILSSKLLDVDGQPYTGNDLFQLLGWLDSRRTLIPKKGKK
jgi:hypothetical protein